MKLLELAVDNFRGAPNGVYSFADPLTGGPRAVTIVTGPPASGKTALLEAIAALKECVGAYGSPPALETLLHEGAVEGSISARFWLSPDEMQRARAPEPVWSTEVRLGKNEVLPLPPGGIRSLLSRFDPDPARAKVEYFPANRRLSFRANAAADPVLEARLRLAKSPDKYAGVRQALVDVGAGEGLRAVELIRARGVVTWSECPDELAPYRNCVASLAPDLRLRGLETRPGGVAVLFERRDGRVIPIEELSESEQQAVLFAVTFVRIGLANSIVLIDEPELHIHADARAPFLAALSSLGSDNQLIVATGSHEIVAAAAEWQVVRLGAR
jgi:hypothetical protein